MRYFGFFSSLEIPYGSKADALAEDEFSLERNLAPSVPSAFSSWTSKARFADAGPVGSVSSTVTLQ